MKFFLTYIFIIVYFVLAIATYTKEMAPETFISIILVNLFIYSIYSYLHAYKRNIRIFHLIDKFGMLGTSGKLFEKTKSTKVKIGFLEENEENNAFFAKHEKEIMEFNDDIPKKEDDINQIKIEAYIDSAIQ